MTGEAKASSLGGIRIMMCRVPVVGQFLPFMQTLQFWFLDKTLQLDLVPKQMEPQVWFLTPKKISGSSSGFGSGIKLSSSSR
jgi:hypothetical protein